MLLQAAPEKLDLYGVEVPGCVSWHLPAERLFRVPSTTSLYPETMLASGLMFVYPRKSKLVADYIHAFAGGALECVAWLSHRSDFSEVKDLLFSSFHKVELIDGPGIPPYELLVVASMPMITLK